MPVIKKGGKDMYINPFYQQVDSSVISELNTRASYYGRRVRGVGAEFPKNVAWSYQKTAWGHVISVDHPSITLGFPSSKLMSDRNGNLTLYNAQRNVPKKPLLTSIEISNEGTIGSLLKGKFSFTIFPLLTKNGFDIEKIEEAFFMPGKEVEISWGWSIAANNHKSCAMQFTGIIYNFNWQFNGDMSITADVSIVSAASIALGQSGDQSVKKDDTKPDVKDPKGVAINGNNLVSVIDSDLAILTKNFPISNGQMRYVSGKKNSANADGQSIEELGGTGLLDYIGIGLPFQENSESTGSSDAKPKVFWYVKLGGITEFANELIKKYEDGLAEKMFDGVYKIVSFNNETAFNKDIKSAYPIDVYFPDSEMGKYGSLDPFAGKDIIRSFNDLSDPKNVITKSDVINIGNILLGTDHVKNVYNQFVEKNSTNIAYKNITSLFDELIKKINMASGDMYQLTVQMYEPKEPSDAIDTKVNKIGANNTTVLLSIEDSNIALTSGTEQVHPFQFDATIFKPLIKNAAISSHPPGPLATAAYAQARGKGKALPSNSDVSTTAKDEKNTDAFDSEYNKVIADIEKNLTDAPTNGFNDAWSNQYRGNLVKYKKLKIDGKGEKNGAHWLKNAIYPIDLTLTIDGIAGFKFGDTIATSLIPKQYNELYKMVFTITKISHTIKDGIWETTLNTKSRINMDGTSNNKHITS